MTDIAGFWDKIAPKYAQDAIKDMAAYEYTLERTKSYLKPKDHVLEIGCGTGSTALLLSPHVRDYVGTDISSGMVDIARAKAKADAVQNLHFEVAAAQDATKVDGVFDVVLGFNIFHLTESTEHCIADIHRILPVGGHFISKTPCLWDRAFGLKRYPIRAILPLMQLIGKAPPVQFMTQIELEGMITSAGFAIVESGNFPTESRYIVARRI